MKNNIFWVLLTIVGGSASAQDWKTLPVPADAGAGKKWELQEMSDDFNYQAPAKNKGETFAKKWTDSYHNAWTGPGLTIWDRGHSFVENGQLQINVSRTGTNKVNTGCITSKTRVKYPVYVEARAKIMNSVLANAVWLLSPDDTQEIDLLEAYGSSYSENAQKDQTWFAERIHISHHVFIRQPFQDYQPTDAGSWYYNGTLWRNDFHTYGVYWIDPWNMEFYIDGKMIRKVSGKEIIDPKGFTNGTGLNKEMDLIINAEDQNWRSDQKITPTDNELKDKEAHTYRVDWVRVYKPVEDLVASTKSEPTTTLSVYPNPGNDSVTIVSQKTLKKLYILSPSGQTLKTVELKNEQQTISTRGLNTGSYIFKIEHVDGTFQSQKISINN
jgi:beta-agarase